ncbi:MAG: rhodanese-like domain-containing protein [bacterium]
MIKRTILFQTMFILFILLLITGCFTGYKASEGDRLEQYLSPESLKSLVENPETDIRIIDVRPGDAYVEGHIPSAESFPSSTIMSSLDKLPKKTWYIIYCETGGRAQRVIRKLMDKGYTRLMNWGGYTRWSYPLVSEKK